MNVVVELAKFIWSWIISRNKIYFILAGAVAVTGFLWWVYLQGYNSAKLECNIRAKNAEISQLKDAVDSATFALNKHKERAKNFTELQKTHRRLINETPSDNHDCFDGGHIKRLRNITQ